MIFLHDCKTAAFIFFMSILLGLSASAAHGQSGTTATEPVRATDGIYEDRIKIEWLDDQTQTQEYVITRADSSTTTRIATLPATESTFEDAVGTVTGYTYTYCVLRDDGDGTVETIGCDRGFRELNPVGDLTASSRTEADAVELRWQDRSAVEEGVVVYRKPADASAEPTVVGDLPAGTQAFDDTSATPDAAYQYCVAAADDTGESERRCAVGIRAVVQPPSNVQASEGSYDDRVFLSWSDDSNNDLGYRIFRAEVQSLPTDYTASDLAAIADTDPNATTYSDLTANVDVDYAYCVATIAEGGDTSIGLCTEGVRGVLLSPENVAATRGTFDDRVEVTWTDRSSGETGFEVWRREAGTEDSLLLATPPRDAQQYVDISARRGSGYVYAVRAIADEGGRSAFAQAAGRRAFVIAPTDVAASDSTFEDRVEIAWDNASTTASVTRIYRDGQRIDTVPATTTQFTDTEIASGTVYTYCIENVTDLGVTPEQDPCDTAARLLVAPEGLAVTNPDPSIDVADETAVTLTWTDASGAEAGYVIERDGAAIDTVAADAESYRDPTARVGQVYTYAVRAYDAEGQSEAVGGDGRRRLRTVSAVSAGDGEFESRVRMEWSDNSDAEDGYLVRLETSPGTYEPLDTLDANSTTGLIPAGTLLGKAAQYCVGPFAYEGADLAFDDDAFQCETGSTAIRPPASVHVESYSDRTVVSWEDDSSVETGFQVWRNGSRVPLLPKGTTRYEDAIGRGGVEYEVATVRNDVESERIAVVSEEAPTYETPESRLIISPNGPNFGKGAAIGQDFAAVSNADFSTDLLLFQIDDTGTWSRSTYSPYGANSKSPLAIEDGYLALTSEDDDTGVDYVEIFKLDPAAEYFARLLKAAVQTVPGNDALEMNTPNTHIQSIAMDGHYMVVGVPDKNLSNAGTGYAYVYRRVNGVYVPCGGRLGGKDQRGSFGLDVSVYSTSSTEATVAIGGTFEPTAVMTYNRCTQTGRVDISTSNGFIDIRAVDVALASETRLFLRRNSVSSNDGVYTARVEEWRVDVAAGTFSEVGELDLRWESTIDRGSLIAKDGYLVVAGIPTSSTFSSRRGAYVYDLASGDRVYTIDSYAGQAATLVTRPEDRNQPRFLTTGPGGRYGFYGPDLLRPVADVTQGNEFDPVELSWTDVSDYVQAYRILRGGERIAEVDGATVMYRDDGLKPGEMVEYCIVPVRQDGTTSRPGCRTARSLPDGAITGTVTTPSGASVKNANVCLDPSPGQSLLFDGEAESAGIRSDVTFAAGGATFEAWIRSASNVSSRRYPFSYATASTDNAFTVGVLRQSLSILIDGQPAVDVSAPVDFNDGAWHHLAFSWRPSGGGIALDVFVDGTLTETIPSTSVPASGGTLVLGQEQDALGGGFSEAQAWIGQIDDVRIWSTPRTAAEVAGAYTRRLAGTEPGLQNYWAVDRTEAPAVADLLDEEEERYVTLVGGVHRSTSSPARFCARTDDEGNYDLSGIRYDGERTFRVIPELGVRQFQPAYKSITLSEGNPVQNEIGFRDVSAFGLKGRVRLSDTGNELGGICSASDIPILVDGVAKTSTDRRGEYGVGVLSGEQVIQPEAPDGRSFEPASQVVFIDGDTTGIDFLDTTTRSLSGRVGGGCDLAIGTFELLIRSENGCYERTVTTNNLYDVKLPPQTYSVQVTNVTLREDVKSVLSPVKVNEYFEAVGESVVDLTARDTTLDFTYRAPLTINVEGGPSAETCQALTVEDQTLPNVTVIAQGPEPIPFRIRVDEDYGALGTCPVDTGTVRVRDEWSDTANEPRVYDIENGLALDTAYANTPTFTGRSVNGINRSYQKAYTVDASVEGRTATRVNWALITGRRQREGSDFTTVPTKERPLFILRDPPGDNSFATLEEGFTKCDATTGLRTAGTGNEGKVAYQVGVEFQKGTPFFSTKSEYTTETGAKWEVSLGETGSEVVTTCITTTETFSTSSDPTLVGAQGDVFIGAGQNFTFAQMDNLNPVERDRCTFTRNQTFSFQSGGVNSTFIYTRYHIENGVIGNLRAREAGLIRQIEEQGSTQTRVEDLADVRRDIQRWQDMLAFEDSLKVAATDTLNLSFASGGGYTRAYEEQNTTQRDTTTFFEMDTSLFTEINIEESGAGMNLDFALNAFARFETTTSSTYDTSRTVSYTLSDDDIGDAFLVKVKSDDVYRTPVFELLGGRSSCPWEGPTALSDPAATTFTGTQPRDSAVLQTSGIDLVTGADPNGEATLQLQLTNDSATDEQREYQVRLIQTSNADGALVNLNATNLSGKPASFFLDPGETGTQVATLSVQRGPDKYRYDDLQVMMYPPCEYALWENNAPLQRADTVSVSAHFEAPCSDVELATPSEGWSLTTENDAQSITVALANVDVTPSEDKDLERIGLEYRAEGSEQWFEVDDVTYSLDTLVANGTEIDTDLYDIQGTWTVGENEVPDGRYELRAFSKCVNSSRRVFSQRAEGVIDRRQPTITRVEPADGVLAFGDELAVQFDEALDCESVRTDRDADPSLLLTTSNGTPVPLGTPGCSDDGRLTLRVVGGLGPYEDSTLVAEVRGLIPPDNTLRGVTDRAGNPMVNRTDPTSSVETWTFTVERRGFAWQNAQVASASTFGEGTIVEENLVNGTPQPVVYSLESAAYGADWTQHPWLVPDSLTLRGTVAAGNQRPVRFAVSDTLSKGTYVDTVRATTALGPEELRIEAEVSCPAPFGTPPRNLPYSMSVNAQIDVPAGLGGSGLSTDTTDVVAAYVGNQLRGVAPVKQVNVGTADPAYVAFLTIAADREYGETVTFRLWDSSQCRAFQVAETLPFERDGIVQSPTDPFTLTATDAELLSVALPSGWTWVSTNKVPIGGSTVTEVLSTVVPSDGDVVKGQADYAQYSVSSGWVGTLSEILPGRSYRIYVDAPSSLVLLGDPAEVNRDVELGANWNWLGYVPQQPLPVDQALANMTPSPTPGDVIKGQFGFAQYVSDNVGWVGSLETMEPGLGYLVRLKEASTLRYPAASGTTVQTTVTYASRIADDAQTPRADEPVAGGRVPDRRVPDRRVPDRRVPDRRVPDRNAEPEAWQQYVQAHTGRRFDRIAARIEQAEGIAPGTSERTAKARPENVPDWTVAPTQYADAVPVVAEVSLDGAVLSDDFTQVAALIDDEVRGVGTVQRIDGLDAARLFVLVYGDPDDTQPIRFRFFNPADGRVYDDVQIVGGLKEIGTSSQFGQFPDGLNYRADAVYGTVDDPIRLNAGDLPDDVLPSTFELRPHYPNPVQTTAKLEFALPQAETVEVEIFDIIGRRVMHDTGTPMEAGWQSVTLDASRLASGVYFYRLTAGEHRVSNKIVVVK